MKPATEYFIDKRRKEIIAGIVDLKQTPRHLWTTYNRLRHRGFISELVTYDRLLRLESGEQVPYGYEEH